VTTAVQSEFHELLGDAGWLTDEDGQPYAIDWLNVAPARAIGVARPSSTHEVSACLKLCAKHRLSAVPQGGNTGLVLGSVPLGTATS